MFEKTKTKLVVAVVVTAAAVLPATAQADSWTIGGAVVGVPTVLPEVSGRLMLIPAGSALRTSCDVSLAVSLDANATITVTDAAFSSCQTNVPGCPLQVDAHLASTLPWAGAGVAASQAVSVAGVRYTKHFGAGCPVPLGGLQFSQSGTLSPVFDEVRQTLSFDGTGSTGTLTGSAGTAYVQGVLDVDAGNVLALT